VVYEEEGAESGPLLGLMMAMMGTPVAAAVMSWSQAVPGSTYKGTKILRGSELVGVTAHKSVELPEELPEEELPAFGVGAAVAFGVGAAVAFGVGAAVALWVGVCVGAVVDLWVDEAWVGAEVGADVGAEVGAVVDLWVDEAWVGAEVGAWVFLPELLPVAEGEEPAENETPVLITAPGVMAERARETVTWFPLASVKRKDKGNVNPLSEEAES